MATTRKRTTQRATKRGTKRATKRATPQRAPQKTHSVRASLSIPELTRAGSSLNLQLYARGEKIGEMEMGQGSLFWYGRNRQKRKRIEWSKFAEMMDELAYGRR
jgi:hypothetical protein